MSSDVHGRGAWRGDAGVPHHVGVKDRLRLLEPLVCLALAGHGLAVQVVGTHHTASTILWAAGLLAVLGVAGLLGWRAPWAATVRAVAVLGLGYALMAFGVEGSGYFLLWFFVLAAVYPLVLPSRASVALIVAVPVAYLLLVPLDAADGPVPVAMLRAVSLALIGVFVHWAATGYREAVSDRDSALAFLDTYVDTAPVGLGFWDVDLRYRRLNSALAALSGLPVSRHLGRSVLDLPEMSPVLALHLRGVLESGESEHDIELTSGDRTWMASCFPVRNGPRLLGVGAVAMDVTEQRRIADALTHSATHDPLTGLPNRALFTDRLTVALEHAERTGTAVAVICCDIDRFKVLNDSLGHGQGDDVLRLMAGRLVATMHPDCTVARLSGDGFAVLCVEVDDVAGATSVGERMRSAAREPTVLADRTVTSTVSVGVTVSTPGERDAAGVLRDADMAVYQAKDAGRDRVAVFDARLRGGASERFEFHAALRHAVENQEITVAYQPVLALSGDGDGTGARPAVVGLEALARWNLPGRGDVPPAVFIPMAEDLGLIHALGEQVLRDACTAVRAWRQETGLPLTVAVNLSSRQLEASDCVAVVAEVLDDVGLPASALVLEITESVLMLDVQNSLRQLGGLRALGVSVAIDDFGTGYSSLAYLRDLPVDIIKIDRSFTSRLPSDETLFVFMVDLAQALGATTVVEGVETRQQLAAVTRVRCDQAQGYFLSRPLVVGAVAAYLGDVGEPGAAHPDEALEGLTP